MPAVEMDIPTPMDLTPHSKKRQHQEAESGASHTIESSGSHSNGRRTSTSSSAAGNEPATPQSKPPNLAATMSSTTPKTNGTAKAPQDVKMRSRSASMMSELSDLGPETPVKPSSLDSSQVGSSSGQPPLKNAFSAMNGSGSEPPRKKVKLTKEEALDAKLKKQVAAAEKALEKERLAKEREADKARREQERAEKEAEREAERKKREAEKEEKRIAREKEAEKREEAKKAKEEERKKKEDERRKAEEEKRKKEAKQPKLNAFFMKPAPKQSTSVSNSPTKGKAASETPEEKKNTKDAEEEEYEKIWPPFFVQSNVTLAPPTRAQRDEEATKRLESDIDDFLAGKKTMDLPKHFSAPEAFDMPPMAFPRRGKAPMPVKDIMSRILGATASKPIDLSSDAYNRQIASTRALLRGVSYKFLKFAEDVRPPYTGTYTKTPVGGVRRLARNCFKRELEVNYDYDSEAEWEEPLEGEELGSEDDEDDVDGDAEDIDGFLDDAEDDLTRNRKLGMVGGELEPVSSGLCWEDEKGCVSNIQMRGFRMDILNENIPQNAPIDPFSSAYWPPPPSSYMQPPRAPLTTLSNTLPSQPSLPSLFAKANPSSSHPSTTPSRQPSTNGAVNNIQNLVRSSGPAKPKKLLDGADLENFRQAVEGSELSKVGLIEVLHKQLQGLAGGKGVAKGIVKNTLEAYCERVGGREVDKRWRWKERGAGGV